MEEETVKFTVWACTKYVGSEDSDTLEVEKEDLEGVPEEDWPDYAWEQLGGQELAYDMCDMGIRRESS